MRRRNEDEAAQVRGAIEALRMRAHLLAGEDRALAEMYLEHGSSLRQIGRLMRLAHQSVGRRIGGILRRLADDTYEICLANRDDFSGRELSMIKDHFVGGLPATRIGRHHGMTPYRVRAILRRARRYAASVKERSAR
ncbi:MAG: hypothetical protein JW955_17895 [Sedimentisphaerales bacterium]|nr:hypothetical protein [Sedimentisphaerales bacterium]